MRPRLGARPHAKYFVPDARGHSMTSTSDALQVPDEPGVYWCARHKNVRTRLRCGRCETPICPKCTRMGPTGARCPDCVSHRSSHVYQVSALQFVTTFFAVAFASAIGVVLIRIVGLLLVFFAPVIGTLFGKSIVRLTRGKRGIPLAFTASLGAVAGALLPSLETILTVVNNPASAPFFLPQLGWALLYLLLVIPSLWWWLK